ncbi:MAG: glycosyltransferase family 2 protein [Candidatus Omnitrophota bacterium]
MEIIANATLFLLLFILAGWVYRSWRSLSELKQAPTLKLAGPAPRQGKVSILIPAKNEEKNIADCVQPLLAQLRENDEIFVINNCSEDRTEAVLKKLGAVEVRSEDPSGNSRAKFKYLNTPSTPGGWTGKNFALHLGIEHAAGDWLLFTDADTRHEPGSLNAALSFAEGRKLDLLTLLPRCLAHGFWEEVIQPCAMGYMGLWFPVRKINDPKSKVYFGNGQYLLIRAEYYRKIGGHEDVKEAFLEDFALMQKTKETGARGMCAFGMEIYGTRMYESFGAIWRGWRRIYLHAFEQKPLPILKCGLSVFFFSFFPFIVLATLPWSFSFSLLLCLFILAIIFATAATAYAIVRARKRYALLHPLAALVFTAILFDAFQMAFFQRQTHWR